VDDTTPPVGAAPPWHLWPERERALAALAETRDELAVRLCRWPLSLRSLARRSGVSVATLSRLRAAAAQDWPTYRRLDDLADAGATIRTARRYARLRSDLHELDARAAAEAERLRAQGYGWRRVNAALGAPPGSDPSWLRVLLASRSRDAGDADRPAGTREQRPLDPKGPKP
jgi:transcriptional regulator with XRE-family HTH domain